MAADCMVVVLGDSPRLPSGLARIATDITERLWDARTRLGIEVLQIGWEYGTPPLKMIPWPLVTFSEIGQDWGASRVVPIIADAAALWNIPQQRVVLLSVWDPARCFEYRDVPLQKWGYFAVDGHNHKGRFGGPAAEAVRSYQRVLAYGEYGATVLHDVVNVNRGADWQRQAVSYLPHGHTWDTAARLQAEDACTPPFGGWRLGCVATNQARKDLSLFFKVLAYLRKHGEEVEGWLHTDELVTAAWSIPELLDVHDVSEEWCTITTGHGSDAWLQQQYAGCAVTLAPGRGEGFGYPIVESYAMGRPVVHVDYAGGTELTAPEGRVSPYAYDDGNPYAVLRPLLRVEEVANRCRQLALRMVQEDNRPLAAFYAGSVAHLHWNHLWPRWETWVRQGLNHVRQIEIPQAPSEETTHGPVEG